ncbi:SUKH-3 domain-containing protein [Streptomyces sp. XD-27]|uniref:SUKH-3 domain-containing protein n=1 Tax=Streptomyces sp. XD-27 TaxID=3062779 RepID=UPI0026F46556|nr:SUKH-3 domain-containing protein [Streptomyces sp. XD-27]WKX72916.1 SUKH-3 domain-containing protein [Streptomyces sp. XD-27]
MSAPDRSPGHAALTAAGWHPGRDVADRALLAMLETASSLAVYGDPDWQPFPAAERALRECHGLTVAPAGPGVGVAPSGCAVDPTLARHDLHTLAAFGEELGEYLFPFGRTDAGALLAVDESGRLFAADHSGWWLLGDSAAAGLVALAEGRAPQRAQTRHWRWELARTAGEEIVPDLVKSALALAHILHRHGLMATRALQGRVTGFRGYGQVHLDQRFPLRAGSLEANAEQLAGAILQALGPMPLATSEVSLELLPGATGRTPRHATGWSAAAGGAGVGGIAVRATAPTAAAVDPDVMARLADATAEVDRYAASRSPAERH